MPDEQFRVPSSTLEELESVIAGYAHVEKNVGRDDVAKVAGVSREAVSRNNRFLHAAGIVEGGNKKNVTPLGKSLGRAIQHKQEDDANSFWQQVVKENEFLSDIISTVRIRNGMTEDELAAHLLYASDASSNQYTERGARTLVEIFKKSGLLEEENGKLVVAKTSRYPDVTQVQHHNPAQAPAPSHSDGPPHVIEHLPQDKKKPPMVIGGTDHVTPTIAINIQLHIPEVDDPVVYDNLFRSLRKHLLSPDSEENE